MPLLPNCLLSLTILVTLFSLLDGSPILPYLSTQKSPNLMPLLCHVSVSPCGMLALEPGTPVKTPTF